MTLGEMMRLSIGYASVGMLIFIPLFLIWDWWTTNRK